jgi:hypothetical protein
VQRYAWTEIRWFTLQDVRLSAGGGQRAMIVRERTDAVELPDMDEWPPAELVALLEEKRKIYT